MERKHTNRLPMHSVIVKQRAAIAAIGGNTEQDVTAMGIIEHHEALNHLAADIHANNRKAGWWDNPREDGTLFMLMVSEISEAMEGARKDLMDDKLPHHKMVDVELADAIIRILDYCGAYDIDIGGIVAEKRAFNMVRPDHQRENRALANGKKF